MRTRVELHAEAAPDGSTRIVRSFAQGALGIRLTDPGTVHLIATAAGPLGGDDVEVALRVGSGATLRVRSVAASVVLPGRLSGESWVRVRGEVDGALDLDLEPSIVTAQCLHHSDVMVMLGPTGSLRWRERVQLGRDREPPGRWSGRAVVTCDGAPVLRQTLRLGPGSPTWDDLMASRAVSTELRYPASAEPYATATATVLPLAGEGVLLTAVGDRLADLTSSAA